ncbi:hypothetical protein SAMN05216392_0390 [Streptococcus equinus]|uniref:Uncharacterized protein n=1 Tax=Streptococcus equinus TaxID=1335 RepID=A0A1H0Y396_STREI|nr:hypothetical protein Javan214_0046 [Streptococcus phage Javan214]SDQ09565.1 hypothetical protein SAMN05216392_0390 [Streptococcus equinus]
MNFLDRNTQPQKNTEYLNSKGPTTRQLPEKAFHQQPKPKNK